MEGIYYFGEHVRWNLGFVNPNIAGAFIAMLLAFVIPFSGKFLDKGAKRVFSVLLFFIIEAPLWFLLAKTYSRGALAATCICVLAYAIILSIQARSFKQVAYFLLPKVALLALILCATGFIWRTTPSYISGDGSVSARTTLWQGGLKMVATEPISGWGKDNSGSEYINWYQDIDDERKYAGMVNSYLYMAVERGLPILFVGLGFLLFFVFWGVNTSEGIFAAISTAGGLGILSYLTLNFFSTLIVFNSMQILLGLFIGIIVISNIVTLYRFRLGILGKVIISAFTLSFACCFGTYSAGYVLNEGYVYRRGCMTVFSKNKAFGSIVLLMPDEDILGKYYGKELRKVLLNKKFNSIAFAVLNKQDKIENKSILDDVETVVLFGKSISCLKDLNKSGIRIVVVNPIGNPDITRDFELDKIFLPELDVFNQNPRWAAYSSERQLKADYLSGSAQRITDDALAAVLEYCITN